uniref:Putative secreted protein n=1 Tax=Ixodes ricinus TaxID=34613 RepID=A0A6B0UDS8_IXORI
MALKKSSSLSQCAALHLAPGSGCVPVRPGNPRGQRAARPPCRGWWWQVAARARRLGAQPRGAACAPPRSPPPAPPRECGAGPPCHAARPTS